MSSPQVRHSLSFWVMRSPKFQVFWAVIVFYTVSMVDVFKMFKRTPKDSFHNNAMLKNLTSVSCLTEHYITCAVQCLGYLSSYSLAFPRTVFGFHASRFDNCKRLSAGSAGYVYSLSFFKTVNRCSTLFRAINILAASSLMQKWRSAKNAVVGSRWQHAWLR